MVAMTSAAGLTLVDLIFVARRRISPVYLLDAMAEASPAHSPPYF
jgi:hypothetical protein